MSSIHIGRPRKTFQIHRSPSGYVEAVYWHRGKRYREKLHRLVKEVQLGRKLDKDEHVHHDDHHKDNVKVSNLKVLARSAHVAFENRYRASKGHYQGAVKQMLLKRLRDGIRRRQEIDRERTAETPAAGSSPD